MTKFLKKIKIHPLTYIIISSALLTGLFKYLIIVLGIVLFHELGHITFSLIFKRKISEIVILPFGGLTKIDSCLSSDINEDLLISIGGILFQLIIGLIFCILHKNFIIDERLYNFFYNYNSSIIIFNLIPINPLDGYKIFKLLCQKFIPYKYSFYIGVSTSFVLIIILIFVKPTFVFNNIFVFIFMIYMCFKEYYLLKYIMNRFYIERMNRTFNFKNKNIKKIDHMHKNKNNILNGKNEKDYLKNIYLGLKNIK